MGSRLQDVVLRGTAASKPLATAVAPGTQYFSTDTQVTERSDGAVWQSYSAVGVTPPAAHAPSHSTGGSDPVTVTALAGYPGTTSTFLRGDHTFAAPTGFAPGVHASTHSIAGSDPVAVTNLAGYPGGTGTFLRGDGTFSPLPTGTGSGTVTHSAGALASGQLIVGNAAADLKVVAATDGQIPIGKTSDGSVVLATLTAGANITITNAGGVITIAAAGAAAVRRQVTVIIDGGGSVITTGVKAFLSLPVAGTWKKWRVLSVDAAATAGSIVLDVWVRAYPASGYPPTVANTITASAKPTLSTANIAESTSLGTWIPTFAAGDILAVNVDSVVTLTKAELVLEFE